MTQHLSTRPLSAATLLALSSLLFACARPESDRQGPTESSANPLNLTLHRGQPWRDPNAAPLPAPPPAKLTYYGGRVVSNMQVVQVLYGTGNYLSQVSSTASPSMATFYQGVLNSSYVDWLAEYNTNTQTGTHTNQIIGRGAFVSQVKITPSVGNDGSTISDAQIQSELTAQIVAGNLPAPTADAAGNNNTYYAVFFPPGKSITQGGTNSCQAGGFCAYHGTIASVGGKEVYYGVHPDMQAGSGCATGCGSAATTFGNYTSVASHEMGETITDCEVGLATANAPPLAWYDSTSGEIGDICNAQQGSATGGDGVAYVVQKLWSNSKNACIVGIPPPSVSFTAPAANAMLSGTAVVTITASPAAATSLTKLAIGVDGTQAQTGTASPLTYNWDTTTATNGAHSLLAFAQDVDLGSAQAFIPVTVQNNPKIVFTNPTDGSVVNGQISVSVTATSALGTTLQSLTLSIDGAQVATGASSPQTFTWDTSALPNGAHSLSAKAVDADTGTTTATISVNLLNGPQVAWTSPADGGVVSGNVALAARATPANGTTLAQLTLAADGTTVQTGSSSPVSGSWSTASFANGSTHTLTATGTDADTGTAAATVSVTVKNPPSVSITTPTSAAPVSKITPVTATATAPQGTTLSSLALSIDGASVQSGTTSPQTFSWDTTKIPNGSHTLSATATDADGTTATATIVTVNVSNGCGCGATNAHASLLAMGLAAWALIRARRRRV